MRRDHDWAVLNGSLEKTPLCEPAGSFCVLANQIEGPDQFASGAQRPVALDRWLLWIAGYLGSLVTLDRWLPWMLRRVLTRFLSPFWAEQPETIRQFCPGDQLSHFLKRRRASSVTFLRVSHFFQGSW